METTMWGLGFLSPLEIPMAGVLVGSLGFWAFCQVWRYLSLTKAPSRLTDGPEDPKAAKNACSTCFSAYL